MAFDNGGVNVEVYCSEHLFELAQAESRGN